MITAMHDEMQQHATLSENAQQFLESTLSLGNLW